MDRLRNTSGRHGLVELGPVHVTDGSYPVPGVLLLLHLRGAWVLSDLRQVSLFLRKENIILHGREDGSCDILKEFLKNR